MKKGKKKKIHFYDPVHSVRTILLTLTVAPHRRMIQI